MAIITYNRLFLFGPIILACITLVILIKFKIRHPFWDKQPVMRVTALEIPGVIGMAPIFNIKLKSGYKLLINNYPLLKIKTFLEDNFSNNYNINEDYLNNIISKPGSHNITLLKDGKIIGFIHSEPIDIMIYNSMVKFRYVDYLCIHETHRNNYMATLLIAAVIKLNNRRQPIMFKKDYSKLPYTPFISTAYFIKDIRKLNPGKVKNIKKLTPFNFYKYLKYTNTLLNRFHMRKPYTKAEFFEVFLDKCIMDFIIIENQNGLKTIIIGKKNIYTQHGIILNCFEIDIILGELRYIKDVDKCLSNHLKSLGYNYICIPAIGSNIKFIKDNEYKINSRVYYYTYNYNIPNILPNECALNIN